MLLQALDATTIGEGALFLIVGGLFMLGLVVALVVLRSIFPSSKPSKGLRPDTLQRRALPTPDLPQNSDPAPSLQPLDAKRREDGRQEASRLKPSDLDVALAHMLRNRWAQPRLLRHMDDRTVVRLIDCDECRQRDASGAGCSFHAGFLEGVMRRLEGAQAEVTEVRCRRAGHPACEFEVRH